MPETKEAETSLSIKVFPDSLEQTLGGPIIGVIEIRLKDTVFPGSNWYDFVVIILGWWLSSTYSLVSRRSETVHCEFMDGPFRFSLDYITGQRWRIRLTRNTPENQEVAAGIVDSKFVLNDLLESAHKIIAACKNKGWISNDIRELEDRYASLKSLVS
jgi:hypothetical protein